MNGGRVIRRATALQGHRAVRGDIGSVMPNDACDHARGPNGFLIFALVSVRVLRVSLQICAA